MVSLNELMQLLGLTNEKAYQATKIIFPAAYFKQ
jgi:hypothetical protein